MGRPCSLGGGQGARGGVGSRRAAGSRDDRAGRGINQGYVPVGSGAAHPGRTQACSPPCAASQRPCSAAHFVSRSISFTSSTPPVARMLRAKQASIKSAACRGGYPAEKGSREPRARVACQARHTRVRIRRAWQACAPNPNPHRPLGLSHKSCARVPCPAVGGTASSCTLQGLRRPGQPLHHRQAAVGRNDELQQRRQVGIGLQQLRYCAFQCAGNLSRSKWQPAQPGQASSLPWSLAPAPGSLPRRRPSTHLVALAQQV